MEDTEEDELGIPFSVDYDYIFFHRGEKINAGLTDFDQEQWEHIPSVSWSI